MVYASQRGPAPKPYLVANKWGYAMPDVCRDIVVRWFANVWGRSWNANIVADLGASDIRLRGWGRELCGRAAVVAFMTRLREAFPDLHFRIVGVIAVDGDRAACRWDGGGTHSGAAFRHHRLGVMNAGSGRIVHSSGTTLFCIRNGLIAEELIAEDPVRAMQPLGNLALLFAARS